jgi:predicted DNA-binding protein (MmcQ/YjbR family)
VAVKQDRTKWHPFFATLYDHAAAKPGAELTQPWGHSVFGVAGKNFVWMGNPDRPGVTVKPFPGSRDVLVASNKATVAQYIGRFGWVDFHVKTREQLALALDLIDESYEHVIPKRKREAAAAAAASGAPTTGATAARRTARKTVAKKGAKTVAKAAKKPRR